MEATATTTLRTFTAPGLAGPTPLLRMASDERLVAFTRAGNQSAYETLVARYQARLLAFCRHMLSSKEDAEDVLQEVFAAAFNALMSDDRPVNVRPWLYRIARNRSLNHLRKRSAIGVDSMDIHLADNGTSTADRVHQREDFRQLMGDVQTLPETQRTALLLREIDALSYDQIAEAMDTTVPSIKSLLVRARVSLAEAAESRLLTCEEVRDELGSVAEGLTTMSPPVRRHVKQCERCGAFRKYLKANNKQLAAIFPLGPLLLLKKFVLANAGGGAAAASASGAGSSALNAGVSALASKAAAGMAAAAIVTAGAAEVNHAQRSRAERPSTPVMANVAKPTPAPVVIQHEAQVAAEPVLKAAKPEQEAAVTADAAPVALEATPPETDADASLPAQPAPVIAIVSTPPVTNAPPAPPVVPVTTTPPTEPVVTPPTEPVVTPPTEPTEPVQPPLPELPVSDPPEPPPADSPPTS
ncbi:MAG TPA: RNA polymerase sigma factor [Baekduia sp.]|nr:RNA polymerase sigma factor [Baekduia sp.]